jgi:putative endonuclease
MASGPNGTLYVGVTSGLVRRVAEHKSDLLGGFTAKYRVHVLVYFELHAEMHDAILREKQIKEWRRRWKLELIEKTNPQWRDLYPEIIA